MINSLPLTWQFPYGCAARRWSPSFSYYLGSIRRGFYLFDAAKAAFLVRRASFLLSALRRRRASLLLLLPSSAPIISVAGTNSTITDSAGVLSNWFNRSPLEPLPSSLLLLDSKRSAAAIEGFRLGLPTVGVVSADWDTSCFTHPIPLSSFSLSLLQSFLPRLVSRTKVTKRHYPRKRSRPKSKRRT